MGLFGGEEKSLESLHDSVRAIEEAENHLIVLKNQIQQEMADTEKMEEQRDSLLREADQANERKLNQLATADVLKDEIEELRQRIESLKSDIEEAKAVAKDEDLTAKKLSSDADQMKTHLASSQSSIESGKNEFSKKKGGLDTLRQTMHSAYQKDRKKRNNGPSAGSIRAKVNDKSINTLHALGDVHGWAPGLINYMMHHELAALSISGKNMNLPQSMLELFQSPIERTHQKRSLPRVGLDGNPMRSQDIFTPHHRIHVKEHLNNAALICVGDVIDRGDHNELVLEILRQSIYTNMGHRWVTLGNHEQMILENDFRRWSKNELNYMAEANKDHAGSYLHQPALTGCATLEDGLSQNFKILEGGLGALLLTQHLALLETLQDEGLAEYSGLCQPIFQKLSWTSKKIKSIVESSTWELHERGMAFFQTLRSVSMDGATIVPGGIGLMYLNGHLLMHAEPNGLDEISPIIWDDLHNFVTAGGFHFGFARMEKGKLMTPSYLWARNWEESPHGSLRPLLDGTLKDSVTTLIHGHQAGSGIRSADSSDSSPITIKAIDEGMTPYYFYNYGHFEQAFDSTRIPEGYKVVWD